MMSMPDSILYKFENVVDATSLIQDRRSVWNQTESFEFSETRGSLNLILFVNDDNKTR
jgi:hypothetical protein